MILISFQPTHLYPLLSSMKGRNMVGIQCLEDLLSGSQPLPFEDIQTKFNIPTKDIFNYIWVKAFLKQNPKPGLSIPSVAWQFLVNKHKCKGISMFYSLLQHKSTFCKTSPMRLRELDLRQSHSRTNGLKPSHTPKKQPILSTTGKHHKNDFQMVYDPQPFGKVFP